jgi:hypothetical protein
MTTFRIKALSESLSVDEGRSSNLCVDGDGSGGGCGGGSDDNDDDDDDDEVDKCWYVCLLFRDR